MPDAQQRKQLQQNYLQQADRAGVFRVLNTISQRQWIGTSKDVQGMLNRLQFELKLGRHKLKDLQADFIRYGANGLQFEIVDRIVEKETPGWNLEHELAQAKALWLAEYPHQLTPYAD